MSGRPSLYAAKMEDLVESEKRRDVLVYFIKHRNRVLKHVKLNQSSTDRVRCYCKKSTIIVIPVRDRSNIVHKSEITDLFLARCWEKSNVILTLKARLLLPIICWISSNRIGGLGLSNHNHPNMYHSSLWIVCYQLWFSNSKGKSYFNIYCKDKLRAIIIMMF